MKKTLLISAMIIMQSFVYSSQPQILRNFIERNHEAITDCSDCCCMIPAWLCGASTLLYTCSNQDDIHRDDYQQIMCITASCCAISASFQYYARPILIQGLEQTNNPQAQARKKK